MPTTVRVEDDVKQDLDRLQGLLQAETGERLTHSALLARLLRVARRHREELVQDPARKRLTAVEMRARLQGLGVKGIKTDVRKLDEELYGERP